MWVLLEILRNVRLEIQSSTWWVASQSHDGGRGEWWSQLGEKEKSVIRRAGWIWKFGVTFWNFILSLFLFCLFILDHFYFLFLFFKTFSSSAQRTMGFWGYLGHLHVRQAPSPMCCLPGPCLRYFHFFVFPNSFHTACPTSKLHFIYLLFQIPSLVQWGLLNTRHFPNIDD